MQVFTLSGQSSRPPVSPEAGAALPSRRGASRRAGGERSSLGSQLLMAGRAARGASASQAAGNQAWFSALRASRSPAEKVALRNQLVQHNLPLVYAITARMGLSQVLPSEDLRQIGSLGLLRAVEAFDPSRGRSLSSFAVPYIRGAIQHELRDRASLMRVPRALWDLRRRASVLQERRRRLGHPQLDASQLAAALGCEIGQMLEALELGSVLEMRSLDAPAPASGGEASGRPLLDQVADPASLPGAGHEQLRHRAPGLFEALLHEADAASGPLAAAEVQLHDDVEVSAASEQSATCLGPAPASAELSWLQEQLVHLSHLERSLLVGHICHGRSWAELGRELGQHPRQAQRRTLSALQRLQAAAHLWRQQSPPEATGTASRSADGGG